MKEALKNIFKKDATVTRFVVIQGRIGSRQYKVEDHAGRLHVVDSAIFYPPGTQVVVQNGLIVGTGRRAGNHRVYEV